MWSFESIKKLRNAVKMSHRVLFFGRLLDSVTRQDLTQVLQVHGYQQGTIHVLDNFLNGQTVGRNCWVVFAERTIAEQAKTSLREARLGGRTFVVDWPRGLEQSQADAPAPCAQAQAAQPRPTNEEPPASVPVLRKERWEAIRAYMEERYPNETRPLIWVPCPLDPELWRLEYFDHLRQVEAKNKQAGVKQGVMVVYDDDSGQVMCLPRQYPGGAPADDEVAKSPIVLMTKCDNNKITVLGAALSEVPERQEQGWQIAFERHPPSREVEHKCKIHDVLDADRPHEDLATSRAMMSEVRLHKTTELGAEFEPGTLIHKYIERELSLSFAPSFVPASEVRTLQSATSNAFCPMYVRPKDVGAGWDDFDKFHHWQSYGRRIDPELVDRKEWAVDPTAPSTYVCEDDGKKEIIPKDYDIPLDAPTEAPLPLWNCLPANREVRDRRVNRGGRSNRGRGRPTMLQGRW